MKTQPHTKGAFLVAVVATAMLAMPSLASAHARISPPVSVANELQLYSLAVPTEKSGVTTTRIVMTVPAGFSIDSFAPPPPGWHQRLQRSGSGDNAVIQKVTWTGGHAPSGQDALFQFLAQPASSKKYIFQVQQTYSDGSIVNWAGPESSDAPAPTIDVEGSLGGSRTSVLAIIALILGVLGVLAGGFALAGGRRGRPLA